MAMLTEHSVLKRPVALPPHDFSPAMVKAMSAVCTVVMPSLPFPSPEDPATASAGLNPCFFQAVESDFKPDSNDVRSKLCGKAYGKERRAAIEQMYAFDAANTTLPDDTLCLIQARLRPEVVLLVRIVLWLLSTSLGTFLLFGPKAAVGKLPFLQSFPRLSLEQRETCLRSWATSRLYLFRTIFKVLKASFCATAVGKVDESLSNPLWAGTGYLAPDVERVTAEEVTQWKGEVAAEASVRGEANGHDAQQAGAERPLLGKDNSVSEDKEGKESESSRLLDFAVVNAAEEEVRGVAALSAALAGKGVSVLEEQRTTAGLVKVEGGRQKTAGAASPSPLILSCDAVVVGSGCGGAVIAAALAKAMEQAEGGGSGDGDGDGTGEKKRKRGRVLVLEAGGYFEGKDFSLLEGPSMAELFEGGGMWSTSDGGISVLSGRCVGGGSTINWSASFKTPPHVTNEWANEYGLQQFASEEYQQAMSAVCERMSVTADESLTVHNLPNSVLKAGCTALGYHHAITPRNTSTEHSCGSCTFGCRTGEKQGMPQTFLLDAAHRGAVILSRCKALRVITTSAPTAAAAAQGGRKRKVVGLEAEISPPDWFPAPRRKIIIEAPLVVAACGSIQTPALLLRSGFKNPHIGGRLRLHPVTAVHGFFPDEECATISPPPNHNVPISKLPSYQGSHMTCNSTQCANWETSGYGAMIQTPVTHPGLSLASTPFTSSRFSKDMMARFHRLALLIVILRDKGYGRVAIDGKGEPVMHYQLSKDDADNLMDAVIHALRVQRAAGAFEIGTLHNTVPTFWAVSGAEAEGAATATATAGAAAAGDGSLQRKYRAKSDAEFEAYLQVVRKAGVEVNDLVVLSAHQTGSCPMGMQAANSAVDHNGELWEASGLFLGDGSVFPTPVGVNPMVSIEAVAYLIGDRLAQRVARGEFA